MFPRDLQHRGSHIRRFWSRTGFASRPPGIALPSAKSVECSISAVESQCKILLGDRQVALSKALNKLEGKGIRLHPALREGFEKLFAFTSDADGVRHGGIKPSDVDQDLAKFMLVSCSAFANYLIAKGK